MPEFTELTIRQVIEKILAGQIRIPAFQRGFVWDPDQVAYFMDSIYKGYPFGSLLFWRTRDQLRTERNLGPFRLPDRDPDYPIDYVLDGQQRITSVFGVFQTELETPSTEQWMKIYFDMYADPDAQESQFVALDDDEVDGDRHFPLNCLFDTTKYRRATRNLSDADAEKIDRMQAQFKEVRLPVQMIDTNDRTTVAIIFERVNRAGVRLDTLQLLSAWTWSEDFALQEQFEELAVELEPFGFGEVGTDTNLLLYCCAAVITGDPSPTSLVTLNGAEVRRRFQEITNGIRGAIDFLRQNLNVHSVKTLPYDRVLVPLTVFFAVPGTKSVSYNAHQRSQIERWFWRTCFSKRYRGGVLSKLRIDIREMTRLKQGRKSELGNFSATVTPDFFKQNTFRLNTVNTSTFVLLLAQHQPLSFASGTPISLENVLRDCNRNEFHHLYPRAFLRQLQDVQYNHNCLANISFMSRADNQKLGGDAPSVYRKKMPADVEPILKSALCPYSLFSDHYEKFIEERSHMLAKVANKLMQNDY